MKDKIKLIAIVGETASGKSSLAVEIAKTYQGEIICADSRTIYRGMDIGTAKPSLGIRKQIRHHGIDLVKPGDRFTAAQYKKYADEKILQISRASKLPILVGGTGLYIDGVLFDYSFGGDMDEENRSVLVNKSVEELATLAEEKGINSSGSLSSNKRHLIRLIERNGKTESNTELAYDSLVIGVKLSKSKLRSNIQARVEKMFRMGLRKEYNDLINNYGPNSEALTGIGYREFALINTEQASISKVKREIVKNTINYAKRQRTWFKRNQYIKWVGSSNEALELVASFLENTVYSKPPKGE